MRPDLGPGFADVDARGGEEWLDATGDRAGDARERRQGLTA